MQPTTHAMPQRFRLVAGDKRTRIQCKLVRVMWTLDGGYAAAEWPDGTVTVSPGTHSESIVFTVVYAPGLVDELHRVAADATGGPYLRHGGGPYQRCDIRICTSENPHFTVFEARLLWTPQV